MKIRSRNKENRSSYAGLQKGLIIGPLLGGLTGFLIPFLSSGTLPFTESYAMGLGDMKSLITVFYLYCIAGGIILGFVVGAIIGAIIDFLKKG